MCLLLRANSLSRKIELWLGGCLERAVRFYYFVACVENIGNTINLASRLQNSYNEVMKKVDIKKSRYRRWSEDEIKLLKSLFPRGKAGKIAEKTGRSLTAVRQKARELGLTKRLYPWSKKDLILLKKLYPSKMAQQIADQIGRSLPAIQRRIQRLGLRKRLRYDERHQVVKGTAKKLCSKCRKWKGENQFYRNRGSKDGLAGWCRKCLSAAREKRRLAKKVE